MKRLADLSVEDLAASPVWRYEGGTGAEAAVIPARRASLSQEDDEIFLAATDFELFDSSRHVGFCFPADDSSIDYLQPVIVLPAGGHVSFWFEGPPAPEALAGQWSALGKTPRDVFPVAFRCLVPVDGRTVSGRIEGVEPSQEEAGPSPGGASPGASGATKETDATDLILAARPVRARGDTGATPARTTRRHKTEMTVEFAQGDFRGTGVIGNVSPRGMFVRSTRIPGAGPTLRLKVNLPEGRTLVLTGTVVRTVPPIAPAATPSGFGLRLVEDSSDYEELLSRLRGKRK